MSVISVGAGQYLRGGNLECTLAPCRKHVPKEERMALESLRE